MKNKTIKGHGGFQNYIDYIVEISNFEDYSEDGVRKIEETHIDVDAILSEPVSAHKKHESKENHASKHGHTTHTHTHGHAHRPAHVMSQPRREKLIMNLCDYVEPRTNSLNVLSLFFSY